MAAICHPVFIAQLRYYTRDDVIFKGVIRHHGTARVSMLFGGEVVDSVFDLLPKKHKVVVIALAVVKILPQSFIVIVMTKTILVPHN
jgi:hypothetical protein